MKKKNFLNQKNESQKGKDFKRRKAALGRGKHQHASRTVIDLKTVRLKVPTQGKYENTETEREVIGPTEQQLQNVLIMCHSDSEKKVRQGLIALSSIISKSPDLFIQNVSVVLAASLHHLRNGDPDVRDAASDLVKLIFHKYGEQCRPFISVLARHIGATISSPAKVIREQSVIILDCLSFIPHLQPVPSLFEAFPMMIESCDTPETMGLFMQSIKNVLKQYVQKEKLDVNTFSTFQFPRLFGAEVAVYSNRYKRDSVIGMYENSQIQKLVVSLQQKMEIITPEITSFLCSLLMVIMRLVNDIDVSQFCRAMEDGFPYDELPIAENIVIAKFLSRNDESFGPQIEEFLKTIDMTSDALTLAASLGKVDLSTLQLDADQIEELCEISAQLSDEASMSVSDSFLDYMATAPKISRRLLRSLMKFKQSPSFPTKLMIVLRRMNEFTDRVNDALLSIVSVCAPFSRAFLRDFALFISERCPEERREKCIEAVTSTNGTTELSGLISFLMTIGRHLETFRDHIRQELYRLQRLSDGDQLDLFSKLDLVTFTLIK